MRWRWLVLVAPLLLVWAGSVFLEFRLPYSVAWWHWLIATIGSLIWLAYFAGNLWPETQTAAVRSIQQSLEALRAAPARAGAEVPAGSGSRSPSAVWAMSQPRLFRSGSATPNVTSSRRPSLSTTTLSTSPTSTCSTRVSRTSRESSASIRRSTGNRGRSSQRCRWYSV